MPTQRSIEQKVRGITEIPRGHEFLGQIPARELAGRGGRIVWIETSAERLL